MRARGGLGVAPCGSRCRLSPLRGYGRVGWDGRAVVRGCVREVLGVLGEGEAETSLCTCQPCKEEVPVPVRVELPGVSPCLFLWCHWWALLVALPAEAFSLLSIFYPEIFEPGSQIIPSRTELIDLWFPIACKRDFLIEVKNPFMVSLDLLRHCFSHHLSQNFYI